MRNSTFLGITSMLCISLIMLCCKSEQPPQPDPKSDTRVWVQDAYAKIDIMKISYAFNEERAKLMRAELDKITDPGQQLNMSFQYAIELLKSGRTLDAINLYNAVSKIIMDNKLHLDPEGRRNLYSSMGIAYMRHGEIENCLKNHNHESCFIPIKGGGIHQLTEGSRNAIALYEQSLKEFPEDLETRYLLNLAYMTLGEYPHKVPKPFLIDPSWFTSKVSFQPFKDISPQIGLNRQGHAGGVVLDDFTNDGWLDIVITSWDPKEELLFYKNNGDGTFSDQTEAYGLKGQVGILHLNQTDYNNDGWLDLYLMRGAWYRTQGDIPNTLLMNTGKGSFVDATLQAGLTRQGPTQTSAWADFNLDGWLDLVVAYESMPGFEKGIDFYINQQNGTFTHESAAYGLIQNQYFKGCVAADVNNDRYPDIYLSSLISENSLYMNMGSQGKKGFIQASQQAGVNEPLMSFPCFSFDFDNDGNEDIFVSSFNNEGTPGTHWMQSHMGKVDPSMLPRLFHNKGNMTFENVAVQMGLTEVVFTMGCNFGDINSDGFLDFYLGTGNPEYQSIVPNKMYLNMEGKRFEDVSYSGGFANIQKGHGISFGDLDQDGDEDIYAVMGGAYDGDDFFNCLFENPNQDNNNWVVLKLTGTTANRAAIGARVAISAQENGKERLIYRTVSSGASFGANSLALEVGLRKATTINTVSIQWPCKDCPIQVVKGFEINKAYEIIQNQPAPKTREYKALKLTGGSGKNEEMHH